MAEQQHQCGKLRREGDGRWFYGQVHVGNDGEMFPGALERAIEAYAEDPQLDVKAWTPAHRQMHLVWPTEAPGLVDVDRDITLAEAHARLWAELDRGAFCDVCQRDARRYSRPFHREMATFLVHLVAKWLPLQPRRFLDIREVLPHNRMATKASTDGAYLCAWDLVRRHPMRRGFYKPTRKGVAFVRGSITVPKYASIYHGRAHMYSKETFSITEALAEEIDVLAMLRDTEGLADR